MNILLVVNKKVAVYARNFFSVIFPLLAKGDIVR